MHYFGERNVKGRRSLWSSQRLAKAVALLCATATVSGAGGGGGGTAMLTQATLVLGAKINSSRACLSATLGAEATMISAGAYQTREAVCSVLELLRR